VGKEGDIPCDADEKLSAETEGEGLGRGGDEIAGARDLDLLQGLAVDALVARAEG
jgi:hypothetical protein